MTKTLHNFMLVSEFPPLTSNLKKVHYNTCTDVNLSQKQFTLTIFPLAKAFGVSFSCQIWYSLLAPVSRYWAKSQTGVFLISGFLVNPLSKEIAKTSEPVMILT